MRHGGRVGGLTATLFATGVATGIAAQSAGPAIATPWVQAPLVLAVLALASHLIIRIQVRDDVEAVDLFEAVLAPTIVFFPGLLAVALAAAAKAAVCTLHRNEPVKAFFNVAQWAAATGCGALAFALLRDGAPGLSARDVAAAGAAMLVVALVNYAAFTAVVVLAGHRSLRSVLSRRSIVVSWFGVSAVNAAFGLLFVTAYLHSAAAVVLMAVPLAVLHWGSRGFATAHTDRVRLAGLQAATHVLAHPIDPRDALPAFLSEVRRCFEAECVDLLEVTAVGAVRHRAASDLAYWRGADDGTSAAALLDRLARAGTVVVDARRDADGVLAGEGWRVAAAAAVRTGERTFGVLCVYNRGGAEGFEQGEVAVLEALASELAGALDKAELLERMLEERRQLADIVGNTSDGILTLDESGHVTSWNAALEQITGYPAAELAGRVPDNVLHPRDAHGAAVELGRWRGGEALPVDLQVVTASRQVRWLSCSYTAVPAHDGRGPQLVLMARDVTKSHELDKLKNDFVAHVSHELRTPLAPIKGWAITLLQRGEDLGPDQRREGARAILRQSDRLEQLILNILEDSKVENEVDVAVTEEVVDLVPSVQKVIDDIAVLAPERAVTVHGLDAPARVVGRSVRIEQILANLLANAVKYSPRTEPIEVTIERGAGEVLVSVSDRGPGIPPEARERIFDRFERLADSPAQTGTGLGLYIARRLATTMGGSLTMTPHTGGGSTFTLRLHAVRALAAVG